MKMLGSIRKKLLLMTLVTTFVALTMAGAVFLLFDIGTYRTTLINDMTTQLELFSYSSIPALQFSDERVATENLQLLRFRPMVRAAALYDPGGKTIARYAREGAGPDLPELPGVDGLAFADGRLSLSKRIIVNNEILGTAFLSADYPLLERILRFAGVLALVTFGAMVVSTLLLLRLQHMIVRPLSAIVGTARDVVATRNYHRRAEKISDDEIGVLADAFNDMMHVIERRNGELEDFNRKLAGEVAVNEKSKQTILHLNAELENKVAERTQQLQTINHELESFCHSVSHDLRGPLRAISGFSQALVEELPAELPGDSKRYLDKIAAATTRMGQLIEDLLNLSRVSRGELKRQQVNLSGMAKDTVTDLQHAGADYDTDVSIWDDITVEADPKLLRIVLDNLLSNALKFSSKQPKPKVMVGVMEDSGQEVCFVRDNGAGFDMKYADKLFGAFQRLHAMHEYPGTGVGLATVKRIVNRHGGRIWFNSAPGKGTTFYFTLKMDALSRDEKSIGALS